MTRTISEMRLKNGDWVGTDHPNITRVAYVGCLPSCAGRHVFERPGGHFLVVDETGQDQGYFACINVVVG